jgi:hypothetical protein
MACKFIQPPITNLGPHPSTGPHWRQADHIAFGCLTPFLFLFISETGTTNVKGKDLTLNLGLSPIRPHPHGDSCVFAQLRKYGKLQRSLAMPGIA